MIAFSNVSDEAMTVFHLARKGYATIREIEAMDTPEFLDLVEFESIALDIEADAYGRRNRTRN